MSNRTASSEYKGVNHTMAVKAESTPDCGWTAATYVMDADKLGSRWHCLWLPSCIRWVPVTAPRPKSVVRPRHAKIYDLPTKIWPRSDIPPACYLDYLTNLTRCSGYAVPTTSSLEASHSDLLIKAVFSVQSPSKNVTQASLRL